MTGDRDNTDGRPHLTRRSWLAAITASVAVPAGISQVGSADEQGYGAGGYGDGPYGSSESREDDEQEEYLSVETDSVDDIDTSTAWVTGDLTELEGYESATVWFEWGESSTTLPNTSAAQTLGSAGEFVEELFDLTSGTEYEVRAVAEVDGTVKSGETLTFTTDEDESSSNPDPGAVPDITHLTGRDVSSQRNPHVDAELEWEASIDDSDLYAALLTLSDPDGTLKSWKYDLSGESAGETETKRIPLGAHGEETEYSVELIVYSYYGNYEQQTITFTSQ